MHLWCRLDDLFAEVCLYVARTLEALVAQATQQFPVVLLTGARQVGKTTLLRHLSQEARVYVTLVLANLSSHTTPSHPTQV
jgi:stage III sporulation protein SpoIIIAA